MTDIKQTLATAFDDEPPLTIDRAAILRTGRRKANVRRGVTTAAVLATVTAVCVPAMLGSGGGGGAAQVGAGGSPTRTTAGPTPTTTGSTTGLTPQTPTPTTTRISTSVSRPTPPRTPTVERATELTALLVSSGAIPADARSERYGNRPTGPWEFAVSETGYASVTHVTTGAGRGQVTLDLVGGELPGCDPGLNTPKSNCGLIDVEGRPVVVQVLISDDPQPVTFIAAYARSADGTLVRAGAMNGNVEKTGVTGPTPPLTDRQLAKIATTPGLTF